ncbi:MAG: S-adenosylmethionine-diacylglycerol 3-amino-3-carboxypropyl transferase [Myxococcota bacterium]|jgi:S-adenosylmethionine-diacylglycerol 3-amino-3-carboxypropyl transferase
MADSADDLTVLEQRLSYAQCWEDPAILSEALQITEDDDVLSICSAGDNSFALAIDGARSVTALDLSLPQLALAELKLHAIRTLPPDGVYTLLGLNAFGRRVFTYHQIRSGLSMKARQYWDLNEVLIREGLLAQGRFEKYLAQFRTRLMPLVHRRVTINALLAQSDPEAQQEFFKRRWSSLRWRGLFQIFFSRRVMAAAGRSERHFQYVDGPVSRLFLDRAAHVLTEIPIKTNPFVQWILSGGFPDTEQAHPYLSVSGQAALRAAADRIRFVAEDLETHLESCEPGTYSAFNYSNVFEYLSEAQHVRILELTARAARPGARIAYWNLLVPRSCPDSLSHVIQRDPERAATLLRRDRAFVYGGFNIETIRTAE